MPKVARWFTSDWHLGHERIIELCQRPFTNLNTMNQHLIDTVNDQVGPEDELWMLGDIAMGRLENTLALLDQLTAGTIVLVAGNHDRVHPSSTRGNTAKAERWRPTYLESALDTVHVNNQHVQLDCASAVQVSHFPYAGSDSRPRVQRDGSVIADVFAPWRPTDDGGWLLCGHVHSAWRQRGRMINVGVDAWAGQPVSENTILELIAAGPAERDPLPWQSHVSARRD